MPNGVSVKLFADDVKLYISYCPKKWLNQTSPLCEAVSNIFRWAEEWQLRLSLEKCLMLYIGLRGTNRQLPCSVGEVVLSSTHTVRDLGVQMCSDLKFSTQATSVARKAFARAKLIFRCFSVFDRNTLLKAYKVYVRSLLECDTQVWNPHLAKDVSCIERVQRYFTRRIFLVSGLPVPTYEDRLKLLDLDTLEARRTINDLMMCYQIVNGCVRLKFSDFFEYCGNRTVETRGHSLKLQIQHSRVNAALYSFASRVTKKWNSLPETVVSSRNINIFKNALLRHLSSSN